MVVFKLFLEKLERFQSWLKTTYPTCFFCLLYLFVFKTLRVLNTGSSSTAPKPLSSQNLIEVKLLDHFLEVVLASQPVFAYLRVVLFYLASAQP
jgi:hypothetical protein